MTATPALAAWDAEWCRWHALAVSQGKTPNQAVPIAYLRTEDRRGPRPASPEGARST
jgi:hypothetical protein